MSLTVYGASDDLIEFEGVVEATHGYHCVRSRAGSKPEAVYDLVTVQDFLLEPGKPHPPRPRHWMFS